jgi:hypothetical protein
MLKAWATRSMRWPAPYTILGGWYRALMLGKHFPALAGERELLLGGSELTTPSASQKNRSNVPIE